MKVSTVLNIALLTLSFSVYAKSEDRMTKHIPKQTVIELTKNLQLEANSYFASIQKFTETNEYALLTFGKFKSENRQVISATKSYQIIDVITPNCPIPEIRNGEDQTLLVLSYGDANPEEVKADLNSCRKMRGGDWIKLVQDNDLLAISVKSWRNASEIKDLSFTFPEQNEFKLKTENACQTNE